MVMCAPSTFCLTITKTTLKSATEKLLALSLYARIAVKAKIDSISRIMFAPFGMPLLFCTTGYD